MEYVFQNSKSWEGWKITVMLLPELEHSSSTSHGDDVGSYIQLVFPRFCKEAGLGFYSSVNDLACSIYMCEWVMADGDYSFHPFWCRGQQPGRARCCLSPSSSSVWWLPQGGCRVGCEMFWWEMPSLWCHLAHWGTHCSCSWFLWPQGVTRGGGWPQWHPRQHWVPERLSLTKCPWPPYLSGHQQGTSRCEWTQNQCHEVWLGGCAGGMPQNLGLGAAPAIEKRAWGLVKVELTAGSRLCHSSEDHFFDF